ncbi:hypothetical protein Hypma_001317 [Hypsizygus marmoreus]|uniref:Uncharacterized protein n=1 Tax=Hypsizygus marmoreus TaxID=39966 RepID=A0A369K637_HYPMA|nr:hypothetical protein Hypma_001317 [Hypsizygus marmoreus]
MGATHNELSRRILTRRTCRNKWYIDPRVRVSGMQPKHASGFNRSHARSVSRPNLHLHLQPIPPSLTTSQTLQPPSNPLLSSYGIIFTPILTTPLAAS